MGTTAERSSIPVPATAGGWVELGRTTLGSAGDTITVSDLADKRYYMILSSEIKSGTNSTPFIRFNNDSGSNYARRYHVLGGEYTNTSVDNIGMNISSGSGHQFQVGYWANRASDEKLGIIHAVSQQTAGAGNAPDRNEIAPKWANTSNAINRVDVINADSGTGDFASGSEVVVLGWDESDTHTNNFWQELASVDLSGGASDTLSTGTITAKKYLWVQIFLEPSGGSINQNISFNNDTGTNYARRRSNDGATDSTGTSESSIDVVGDEDGRKFGNLFIINNSSNEKLVIGNWLRNNTAGAGTAPNRTEWVAKWDNTSSQITEIDVDNTGTGSYGTNSIIKVWGAD